MLRHILESQQFDRSRLDELFVTAREMEVVARSTAKPLSGKLIATLFYEPSTRTRLSFEAAMHRLGGRVISTENAREFSSVAKGETLEDTIRIVGSYTDGIILRHDEAGAARRASLVSAVPIINAGDGPGQHPTQSLLDLYTILKERGSIDGVRLAMVGDLAHGRTVRSLCYLLAKYQDVKLTFVSPPAVRMKDDIKEYLDRHGVSYEEVDDLNAVVREVDVVYNTRIQKERFGDRLAEYESARGVYVITPETLALMRSDAIVLHPLPRLDEIAPEVDADPRAAYFRQAKNGLFVRMALLQWVLGG